MYALNLTHLAPLMARTHGRAEIHVGLIDGPVARSHPGLQKTTLREIPGSGGIACARADSRACAHGTFVAGILCAERESAAPGLCPGCTLLVRPIFRESAALGNDMPGTGPEELAAAIIDSIRAGARVLNISSALVQTSGRGEQALRAALDYALQRGVLPVTAAGNQGAIGSTALTHPPWVIPVVACDLAGRPLGLSNLGPSIGRHGLCAPGANITSLGGDGNTLTLSGTSAAAPFVTGTIALLWSLFPAASAAQIRQALLRPVSETRRAGIVPALLNAERAYQTLAALRI